jgi:predicted dehydrogenase
VRIGLLGTGPWARIAYAPALSAHTGVEFTGVWGRRQEAARELAASFGTEPYEDIDALIEASDAIAFALPPDVQAPLAVRAAERGRHLLLDKPLAISVADARRVAEAVERSGVASVVFFTQRFTGAVAGWVAEQAAAGGWFTGRVDHLASVFTSDTPFSDSPWRQEKGGLWDLGPHALSVLLPVLGDAVEVSAARGAGDTAHLALRHAGGASSTLTLSLGAPPKAAGTVVELRGEHGVVTMPEGIDGFLVALGRAVDALLTAARTGTPHPCDARFGLRVVEILSQAEQSMAQGR